MRYSLKFLKGPGIAVLLLGVFAAGCHSTSLKDPIIGNTYKPANFNRAVEELPKQLKRVAVLPIVPGQELQTVNFGAESLQTEVVAQLVQSGRFEVINVSPDKLKEWTGRLKWSAEERLPASFFKPLRDDLGCDVVLFSRLTVFQAFPPLRVGWNMKLVDARDSKVWWSADEVFDAGRGDVSNAARVFSQQQANEGASIGDSQAILNSPTRFGRYTLNSLFNTLPKR